MVPLFQTYAHLRVVADLASTILIPLRRNPRIHIIQIIVIEGATFQLILADILQLAALRVKFFHF